MADLIIDDEYVNNLGSHYNECSKTLQSAVDGYIATLEKINNDAVTSGEFQNALNGFLQYANVLRDVVSTLGVKIESSCDSFIAAVDEKDQYLY